MKSMINAIIYHGENTLVLELPHSIYDIYEKLMSIGYAGGPNQVKLTDDEGDALRVKLYGRIEMGNHLIRMLSEQNTLADANTLAFAVLNASDDIKELLIANYDLYEREKAKPAQLTLFGVSDDEPFDYEKILKECIISCKIR